MSTIPVRSDSATLSTLDIFLQEQVRLYETPNSWADALRELR
jgi:hypothetical protein